jgi:hypothetical protein
MAPPSRTRPDSLPCVARRQDAAGSVAAGRGASGRNPRTPFAHLLVVAGEDDCFDVGAAQAYQPAGAAVEHRRESERLRRPTSGSRPPMKQLGVARSLPQLLFGDLGRMLEPLERGADVISDDHLDRPQQVGRHVVGDLAFQRRVPVRRWRQLRGDGLEQILDPEQLGRDHLESSLRFLDRPGVAPHPAVRR